MNLTNEFQDRFGFNDGVTVPGYAEEVLDIYVELINIFAEQENSEFRAAKHFPDGSHNPLRLLFLPKSALELEPHSQAYVDALTDNHDSAMERAWQRAHETEIDSYIEIQFQVKKEAVESLFTELRKA